ncbi:M14 family metallopeptidase [Gemmatimonadota bacterium]
MNLPHGKRRTLRPLRLSVALAASLLLVAVQTVSAQRVSIDFDDYHGYEGTVDYIRDVAGAHSNITELIEIGRSNMNRPIYVLVISRMNNGTTIDRHVELRHPRGEGVDNVTPMKSYHGKPGIWIDGGTHGNEYTGTEVSLYIINKLVSGYGSDSNITQLIDENAFYICPIVNPDGVYNSVERGISQRQNSMEVDDDEDGRVNEDGPDDLNGDDLITYFRYPDPEGQYVMDDSDPRIMIRLGRGEETDAQRYSMVREDRDNDGDGERGEDSERGIDVNRNFPEGWFNDDNEKGGSGYYAASSPESRAILEFFTNNTNILMVQSFHTSGGFTYRPFARWADSQIHAKDLSVFDRIMGKKYLELHGEEVPAAWQDPGEEAEAAAGGARAGAPARTGAGPQGMPARAQAAGRAAGQSGGRGYDLPRLWRHPYNDTAGRPYGYGIFIDWAYAQYGAYSMTTELWNWQRDTRGLPGYDGEEDRSVWYQALLAWENRPFDADIFVPWSRYNHPELGQGEVGGFVSTYVGSNALPGETLTGIADIHWQFELFKAGLLPKLEITDASAEVLSSSGSTRIVKVTATVENSGALATHVARGANIAGMREDAIWLIGDRDRVKFLQGSVWQSLGTIDGAMEIPGYDPSTEEAPQGGQQQQMMRMMMMMQGGAPQEEEEPQTGNTREVEWLISMDGNSPLKVVLTSQKGGTRVHQLTVR